MTHHMTPAPSRRALLGWGSSTVLAGLAGPVMANEWPDTDPTDRLPGYYGVQRFMTLSKEEVYMVNLAVKRGRRILIGRYPASVSRQIIKDGARDWPATRQKLLDKGY